jgi:uncharacterized hydrophobic protein (TIGR00341 family)
VDLFYLKKIEVIVHTDEAKNVEEVLDKIGLLFSTLEVHIETKEYKFFSTLLPDELAEDTMSKLADCIDLEQKENMISIYDVKGVTSTFMDKLKEKASEKKTTANPTEELVEKTDRYTHFNKDVLAMTSLATLVALAGLFLDNVVIIIGAMILPPMLGPITALAVNANLGRAKKLVHSQFSVIFLITTIIFISAVTTFIASQFLNLPRTSDQIIARTSVTVFDVLVALILGIAAGLVFRVALSENLFGVALSAALVPPATVSGIQLAFANEILFVGSLILVLVNLFALEFGCTLMLRVMGVTARNYYKKGEGKKNATYSIILLAILLIILAIIIIFSPLGPSSD